MTALPSPLPWTRPPLTAAEYAELPEDPDHDYELQEGVVMMCAKPVPSHQDVVGGIYLQVRAQAPRHLKVLWEVDIDLELLPADQPGTVRAPDLVVVTREAFLRVGREGGFLRAAETLLAVEVHSPSTRRTDQLIKRSEYADAGIGHYWMIDPTGGPSLVACHLGGAFGYVDDTPVTGDFVTDVPFPVRLDLGALV